MRQAVKPKPSGKERTFRTDETIVSKTDPQGRITYVNDVFIRVSAYDERDLIGQPQNIIRHPDMPAAGFKILWDTLQQGKEAFSFIVNLAQDGEHYWVFAHLTPSYDQDGRHVGYHSTRRGVPADVIATIEPIYARIRAAERAAGAGRRAAEAGVEVFNRMLAEQGRDYDQWVWSIASAYSVSARQSGPATLGIAA